LRSLLREEENMKGPQGKRYPTAEESARKGEGVEWQKVWHILEPIVKGKIGLDMGCGVRKLPGSLGVDYRSLPSVDIVADAASEHLLSTIKAESQFDYVFSSHLIEDYYEQDQIEMCIRWRRYLKLGGLLILYVPESGQYKGVNVEHKHEHVLESLEWLINCVELELVASYQESAFNPNMYGLLGIGRRQNG
jgi:hypothetical protein